MTAAASAPPQPTHAAATASKTHGFEPTNASHPALRSAAAARAQSLQLRMADGITKFAGSMAFVYAHVVIFTVWMIFIEGNPWPKLTLIVSLEAIFLSTFVMIGQNRQADFQQAKADHDFTEQEAELRSNTEITRDIHRLTEELHRRVCLGERKDA